ncbi:MAG: hypothetical protein ACJ8AG_13470 [Ktedonobacteraceae bacterium]
MSIDTHHLSSRIFSLLPHRSTSNIKHIPPQIATPFASSDERITDPQLATLQITVEEKNTIFQQTTFQGLSNKQEGFLHALWNLSFVHSHPLVQLRTTLVKLYNSFPIQLRLFGFTCNINANETLNSSATIIMFAQKNNGNVDLCFKMWQGCDNALYHTKDLRACAKYLLEGLKFNKPFARNVYIGIAPVRSVSQDKISCGKLIWFPSFLSRWRIERRRQEYVLVMRRLDQSWRLDHQLHTDDMKTKGAMDLLAKEIARMHKQLKPSHNASGNGASILNKLKLNETEFNAALEELSAQKWPAPFDKNKYKFINSIMQEAYKNCAYHFTQRYESGYVRRCHGDLKATNLWIYQNSKKGQRELLALDCVDFKADFCHIDILSDVAMLAIDLEMRLTRWSDTYEDKKNGRKLTNHFLYTYLKEATAKGDSIWLLLEYYMTEKAMVCAFMSIRYDELPTLGEKYLDVAFAHAQRLQRRLKLLPAKTRQLVHSR